MTFKKVTDEQEHNMFSQTVRQMTGICCLEHESMVMAQIMEQAIAKHNLGQQCLLHKGLKKFGKDGEKIHRKRSRTIA